MLRRRVLALLADHRGERTRCRSFQERGRQAHATTLLGSVKGQSAAPSVREARRPCAKPYSTAMPFLANSFFAFSFLARRVRPMPRSTLGALVNWILS